MDRTLLVRFCLQHAEPRVGLTARLQALSRRLQELVDVHVQIQDEAQEAAASFLNSANPSPMSFTEAMHPDDLEKAQLWFARQVTGDLIDSEYRQDSRSRSPTLDARLCSPSSE